LPKVEKLKMMLGARGLQGPRWVQGKVLVRGPGGQRLPEAPGFKLFWKTHNQFPNSSKAYCNLQITVLKNWFGCPKKKESYHSLW